LNGAANNDRVILGDDTDVEAFGKSHSPSHQKEMDERLLEIARERRKGNVGY
jgi:hypothetical protein